MQFTLVIFLQTASRYFNQHLLLEFILSSPIIALDASLVVGRIDHSILATAVLHTILSYTEGLSLIRYNHRNVLNTSATAHTRCIRVTLGTILHFGSVELVLHQMGYSRVASHSVVAPMKLLPSLDLESNYHHLVADPLQLWHVRFPLWFRCLPLTPFTTATSTSSFTFYASFCFVRYSPCSIKLNYQPDVIRNKL